MDIKLPLDSTDERSDQCLNIAALKDAAYQGLLDIGRAVLIVDGEELRPGRVISFTIDTYGVYQAKTPIPGVVAVNQDPCCNHRDGYYHLEVNRKLRGSELYYVIDYAWNNHKDYRPGILRLAAKEGYLEGLLRQHKGEVLFEGGSSHHSGCLSLYLISMGEQGVALYSYRESENPYYDSDDEDSSEDDQYIVTRVSDGNLYSYDVDFYALVKKGVGVNTPPIRPLDQSEKALLLKVDSHIQFDPEAW